ncbi:hypothetical protein [Sapientia aquatica]|uniref:Uncharacterized protein n=1 Tax=Sapientia aquatica TaxID=1549640 RepID=A0A4R5VWU9_9BURK|nr:hypothetical protein [Sapientia aquatica]TDK62806.1 hypothetical protein E2I14_16040 [Sapientia aquatica]
MKTLVPLLLAGLFATHAMADDIPKHSCKLPVIPNIQASDTVRKYFDKNTTNYKKCIEKFVEEQRQIAKTSPDKTTAYNANEGAEAAVKEYNKFMEELAERNSHLEEPEDANK